MRPCRFLNLFLIVSFSSFLIQFAQLAALVPSRVDVEHNYLNDKLKVLVAYFGELVDYQPEAPADEEAG